MDVFSLVKFWRNAGVGDPGDFDITDDDGSFFELVFTNGSPTVNAISGFHNHQSSKLDGGALKSTHTYSSSPHRHTLFFNNNNKRKILALDSHSSGNITKSPRSPFRVLMLGFKSEKKETKYEVTTTISSLLKRDSQPSKRFSNSKEVVHRYLNMIKQQVSKRSNPLQEKPKKHLGKSRSSSSVKPFPSPSLRRDDDSALQQQEDGIQSAILHCKNSYNQGCSVLSRSGSAPSQGCRISVDEEKRSSI